MINHVRNRLVLSAVLPALLLMVGCKEKTPPRNQIPVLKETFGKLQLAVKARNRASLDSLLSISMLTYQQNGDSLLAVTDRAVAPALFDHFGDAVFLYTGDIAQIECFIMDSTKRRDIPIRFHMIREDKRWLMSHYSFPDSLTEGLDTAQ